MQTDTVIDAESFALLRDAVDTIVAGERAQFPDRGDDTFWDRFRVVLLADVIARHEELLNG